MRIKEKCRKVLCLTTLRYDHSSIMHFVKWQKSASSLSQLPLLQKSVHLPGEGCDQLVHEGLGGLGEHGLVSLLVPDLGWRGDLDIHHGDGDTADRCLVLGVLQQGGAAMKDSNIQVKPVPICQSYFPTWGTVFTWRCDVWRSDAVWRVTQCDGMWQSCPGIVCPWPCDTDTHPNTADCCDHGMVTDHWCYYYTHCVLH